MKIILAAIEDELADAWGKFCGDLDDVTIHRGSILDAACDAIVGPANSYGFLDGGLDAVCLRRFGGHLQERLQAQIKTKHHGELLVGQAEIIDTDDMTVPFFIAAPTMRVPTILHDTINPYLATRAALLLIEHGLFTHGALTGQPICDYVTTVAFPGMGTGIGQVSPTICAHQMRAAIDDVLFKSPPFPRTWAEASEHHQLLYTDRVRNLQKSES